MEAAGGSGEAAGGSGEAAGVNGEAAGGTERGSRRQWGGNTNWKVSDLWSIYIMSKSAILALDYLFHCLLNSTKKL